MTKPNKYAKFRLKLEVDIKDWGTGEWPYELAKAMKVDLDHDSQSVTFEINDETWEQAALKIAKEAVEAFFTEGMHVSLKKDGVSFETDEGLEFSIGFSKIWCELNKEDRDALVRALNANPYEGEEEEGHYKVICMDELVQMAAASGEVKT